MRDKNRIPEICNRLKAAWATHPDLRLGQLIANAVRADSGDISCDPFYIEDDRLIAGVERVSFAPNSDRMAAVSDAQADNRSALVGLLNVIKLDNPKQVLVVETPKGTLSLRVGDALIYEDPHGWVVIDTE